MSAKLLAESDAARARQRARDCLAADPDCPVDRILVEGAFLTPAQLDSLLSLEAYREERAQATVFLQQAVAAGRVDASAARRALDEQRAEYMTSGRTIPIRAYLLDQTAPAESAESLGWSREEDLSEFKLAPAPLARAEADEPSRPEARRAELAPAADFAIAPLGARPRARSSQERLLERRRAEKRKRLAMAAVGLLLALPLGAYVIAAAASSGKRAAEDADAAAPRVSAADLGRAYARSRFTANERYGDRAIFVTGRIAEIGTDTLGAPVVHLEAAAGAERIRCVMEPAEREAVAALSVGGAVEIRGTCRSPAAPGERGPRIDGGRVAE